MATKSPFDSLNKQYGPGPGETIATPSQSGSGLGRTPKLPFAEDEIKGSSPDQVNRAKVANVQTTDQLIDDYKQMMNLTAQVSETAKDNDFDRAQQAAAIGAKVNLGIENRDRSERMGIESRERNDRIMADNEAHRQAQQERRDNIINTNLQREHDEKIARLQAATASSNAGKAMIGQMTAAGSASLAQRIAAAMSNNIAPVQFK